MILTDSFIERYFFKLVTFWVDELCCWIYEWNELLFVVKILILCELSFLRTTWSLEPELNWCWRPYISFSFSGLLLTKKKIWDVIGSPLDISPLGNLTNACLAEFIEEIIVRSKNFLFQSVVAYRDNDQFACTTTWISSYWNSNSESVLVIAPHTRTHNYISWTRYNQRESEISY